MPPPPGHRKSRLTIPLLLILLSVALGGCSFLGIGGSSATADSARSDSVFHLGVGDCVKPPTAVQAELSSVDVVPCRIAHTQEVFALVDDNAGSNYPGASALQTYAQANCLQHFQSYVGVAYQDSSLFFTYLLPSVRSWTQSDRTIVCFITTTGQPLTSSVRHSRR